jgi:hypothetical protein
MGGKCFSVDEEFETEMAEITDKRIPCCGFRSTGKAMDKCINVGGGYVEK